MIKIAQKISGLFFSLAFLSIISRILVGLFDINYLIILTFLFIVYNIFIKIDQSLESKSFFAFRVIYRFR